MQSSRNKKNAIFVAATGQDVGKTTCCLGLISGMRALVKNLGFIKPVGQRHVLAGENLHVDKDVVLFKEYFGLQCDYKDMSPVIIPAGFTKRYLDGAIDSSSMLPKIHECFARIEQQSDFTIVEGTGHCAVGSIINLNNAQVAKALGLEMIILSPGGLGSAFDMLALNIELCRSQGVAVRGIILNRVEPDKAAMLKEYFPKALSRWGVPLIGCIPFNEFLNTPSMRDFELLFETQLLSGDAHHYRHFQKHRLVATSVEAYRELTGPNQLIITPASREDIIDATVDAHEAFALLQSNAYSNADFGAGMILTGQKPPTQNSLKRLTHAKIPMLYSPMASYDAMQQIATFTAKIRGEDRPKVEEAIKHVCSHVDLNAVLAPAV